MANKISRILFYLTFVGVVNTTLASDFKKTDATEWELISDDSGIELKERWITTNTKLKVKERTGKMTLNCSVNDVINLIHDDKRTHLWMKDAELVEVLKVTSNNEWYVHTILDTPWPFSKQDMVSKYKIVRNPDNKITRIFILKEDKLLPPIRDIDRLDTFNAEWVIEHINNNKVKVTFTTTSTKPPKYPSWAQDPVVRKVFTSNLKNFKALLNNKS